MFKKSKGWLDLMYGPKKKKILFPALYKGDKIIPVKFYKEDGGFSYEIENPEPGTYQIRFVGLFTKIKILLYRIIKKLGK